jgi:hypothetical protein
MGAIDGTLARLVQDLLEATILLTIALAAVVYIAGWRAALWGLIVGVAGIACGMIYLKAKLCVKRENSNAKSPGSDKILFWIHPLSDMHVDKVISHFHTAIGGLGKELHPGALWRSLAP